MSDLFGNHIVGFPTRRLIYVSVHFSSIILVNLVKELRSLRHSVVHNLSISVVCPFRQRSDLYIL